MPQPISYVRIYSDRPGETHLEHMSLPLITKMLAPPAAPLEVSASASASALTIVRLVSRLEGESHPTSVKQWLFFLAGSVSMQVSDGTSRSMK
jgi:hypothetical protein